MGLLAKILTGKLAAKAIDRAIDKRAARKARVVPQGEYIPAAQAQAHEAMVQDRARVALDGAGRFYRQNSKMVNTVGAAALALVLARFLQQRRH